MGQRPVPNRANMQHISSEEHSLRYVIKGTQEREKRITLGQLKESAGTSEGQAGVSSECLADRLYSRHSRYSFTAVNPEPMRRLTPRLLELTKGLFFRQMKTNSFMLTCNYDLR